MGISLFLYRLCRIRGEGEEVCRGIIMRRIICVVGVVESEHVSWILNRSLNISCIEFYEVGGIISLVMVLGTSLERSLEIFSDFREAYFILFTPSEWTFLRNIYSSFNFIFLLIRHWIFSNISRFINEIFPPKAEKQRVDPFRKDVFQSTKFRLSRFECTSRWLTPWFSHLLAKLRLPRIPPSCLSFSTNNRFARMPSPLKSATHGHLRHISRGKRYEPRFPRVPCIRTPSLQLLDSI